MSRIKLASCKSVSLIGIDGNIVSVEAHVSNSVPSFQIVGLPDSSLSEAKSRVASSMQASSIRLPEGRITVNLAPASLPKHGSSYDLAILMSILGATDIIGRSQIQDITFIGEIGLDGRLHPVKGILPMVAAINHHLSEFSDPDHIQVVVPAGNAPEASLIKGVKVLAFGHISEVINKFGGQARVPEYDIVTITGQGVSTVENLDFKDIIGQEHAKRASEIAVAGGHNMLLVGPPGTGKTMIARRLPTIMPPLSETQSEIVTSIHSLAGSLNCSRLITVPPFEAPHHTATAPAIIGGGSGIPKPGSVSRAHSGILFLDEAPEFSPRVLQTLRQPLESGEVIIDRANSSARYPARFQLVMAANPCPCGMLSSKNDKCKCSSLERRRYFTRISGPLLDRIDINVEVPNVSKSEILASCSEGSESIRKRVISARKIAARRLKDTPWNLNSEVPGSYLRKLLKGNTRVLDLLNTSVDKGVLSLRGADRVLRVAWTISDLECADSGTDSQITLDHIGKALQFRVGENMF